jgi:hypothetical protein
MSDETNETTKPSDTSPATIADPSADPAVMHPTADELVATKAVDEAAERERYSPEAFIATHLDGTDPDPDAQYSDAEAKVAAALLINETERWGAPVVWSMLRVPHRRIAMAHARKFLRENTGTSRIVRLVLGL